MKDVCGKIGCQQAAVVKLNRSIGREVCAG